MNIFAKPEPQSNAAALAGISALGLLGVVFSDNPAVQAASLAVTLVGLVTSLAISSTEFGKKNFAETVTKMLGSSKQAEFTMAR
jgi:hypothetical protein